MFLTHYNSAMCLYSVYVVQEEHLQCFLFYEITNCSSMEVKGQILIRIRALVNKCAAEFKPFSSVIQLITRGK